MKKTNMNAAVVEAVATKKDIANLANDVKRIDATLCQATNPWNPNAPELTEQKLRDAIFNCRTSFREILENLVKDAGYSVEDYFDEMYLNIFIEALMSIPKTLESVRELAFKKFLEENPNWEEEADKESETDPNALYNLLGYEIVPEEEEETLYYVD